MSQRESGYERKERDLYETPAWVTEALLPHLDADLSNVWEPACGSGKMSDVLSANGYFVDASDISTGVDFFSAKAQPGTAAIITNPPYNMAVKFIQRAIWQMNKEMGVVGMLLRTDFDHAKTRADLFGECQIFAKKIVLTKRIKWFEDSKGSPSFNHAWFIWDWKHQGAPTLAYGP